ncbi:glycosyltransferase, partial [Candidatus Parcubacteria bacterium]
MISVVLPVFNERDNIRPTHTGIHKVLSSLDITWEMVFVDDGSLDDSIHILEELVKEDPLHTRVVQLRRNFGQTAAIAAGIDHAQGDVIVLMDADLQNDPADIPMLVRKLEEGYDVVSGWRKDRQDPFFSRVLPSRVANALISWVTGVHLHDYGCTLKAYRREVLQGFRLYGEMHRFIPAYAASVGARIAEVPVRHHPRRFGRSKYGLTRTVKVILDLFTVKFLLSFFHKPIYLFGGMGLALILPSALLLAVLIVRRVFWQVGLMNSPLFQLSLMFIILGFQSILMGLIAELLVRTY